MTVVVNVLKCRALKLKGSVTFPELLIQRGAAPILTNTNVNALTNGRGVRIWF